jgi:hypothetical protein
MLDSLKLAILVTGSVLMTIILTNHLGAFEVEVYSPDGGARIQLNTPHPDHR